MAAAAVSPDGEAGEQGELMPNRRAKFVGMSINELEERLPFGSRVTMTVTGEVTGDGRKKQKNGVIVYTDEITVADVRVDKVTEPADDPKLFSIPSTPSGLAEPLGDEDELDADGYA